MKLKIRVQRYALVDRKAMSTRRKYERFYAKKVVYETFEPDLMYTWQQFSHQRIPDGLRSGPGCGPLGSLQPLPLVHPPAVLHAKNQRLD
jgi:hypothetical protein